MLNVGPRSTLPPESGLYIAENIDIYLFSGTITEIIPSASLGLTKSLLPGGRVFPGFVEIQFLRKEIILKVSFPSPLLLMMVLVRE